MTHDGERRLCPSAQPDMPDAVAFGVIGGTAEQPVVSYLEGTLPASTGLLQLASPVRPTEVFRFAAPCAEDGCRHFGAGRCRLGRKLASEVDAKVQRLPACRIRSSCRWWHEQGKAACYRCPVVVTEHYSADTGLRAAADPESA